MFVDVRCPENLTPAELDFYLEKGWFRMGQTVFTTNWLNFKDTFYSAIWLRVRLNDYIPDSTQKKLLQRNSRFHVEVRPASVTPEKEVLYLRYKQSVPFEASMSLQALLFGNHERNIFNSFEVVVYDGPKLIGVGFFDLGAESAMGISSIYDPEYKKYSIGKFLIYQKMQYCRQQGLSYFYPGYFVPGYPAFDYKLSIGTPQIEYLELSTDRWRPLSEYSATLVPIDVMRRKLIELRQWLIKCSVDSEVLFYDYFYANQTPELSGAELFDFPIFLTTPSLMNSWTMITYDVRMDHFQMLKSYPVLTPPSPSQAPGYFSEYVLKVEDVVFSTPNMKEMATALIAVNAPMSE